MADLPDTFDPDKQYLITLNRVVSLDGAIVLRPSSPRTIVSGAYAETIRDALVTATEV